MNHVKKVIEKKKVLKIIQSLEANSEGVLVSSNDMSFSINKTDKLISGIDLSAIKDATDKEQIEKNLESYYQQTHKALNIDEFHKIYSMFEETLKSVTLKEAKVYPGVEEAKKD